MRKCSGYIESGKSEEATLVAGVVPHKNMRDGKGFFIDSTIFTDVKDAMKIYQKEIFGPFVVIVSFKIEEEAGLAVYSQTKAVHANMGLKL